MQTRLEKDINKKMFKKTFKSVFLNYNFILFHFVIFFIPFFATLMAGLRGPNGALYVISVGLATSFITIFNQFLFLLSAALYFVCKNHKKFYKGDYILSNIDRSTINSIILLASLFSVMLFILTSYFYITYSSSYTNVCNSSKYGLYYILMLSPSLILNGFIYLDLITINDKKRIYATLIIFLMLAMNMILIPIMYLYIHFDDELLDAFQIGMAITISSFLIFLISRYAFKNYKYRFLFNFKQMWIITKKTSTFIVNFLLATVMKSILIVAIALSLALSKKDTPVNLMLAKIIWYNSLYFCEFFADGLLYSIEYAKMDHFANEKENEFSAKAWLSMSFLSGFVVLITCIIFNLCIPSIANLYTSHQFAPINSPLPPIWPYHGIVNSTEVMNYMWAPDGVYNFKLFDVGTMSFEKIPAFSIMYTTIYHVLISITKIMGLSEININQKFKPKAVIVKFIIVAIIMTFIATFSIVPSDEVWFNRVFPGIDGFSFALMIVGIILFLLTMLTSKKVIEKNKQETNISYNFEL